MITHRTHLNPLRLAFACSLGSLAAIGCGATTEMDSTTTARVRVAHLSPDAPAVDFCLAAHGTAKFGGPLLAGSGDAGGLAYSNVTAYLDVAPGQYDVRLVAPGSADCTSPLGGLADADDLPNIAVGDTVTLAAEGSVAFGAMTPLHIAAYIDDATVDAGKAKLRFIHASPGTPAVDVGIGGGALFTAVFSNVAFGSAASATNGYIETAPIDGAEISARAHGTTSDVISIKPASLPAGAIATAFAIGELNSTTTPLRVLLCVDNAATDGMLSSCAVVGAPPERAHVRFAHLSPDLRAVDVCLAPTGTTAFSGPVLAGLGAQAGLTYAAVTAYVDLPAGKYDIRVILATATGCDTGAIPDTIGVSVDNDQTATIAAIGDFDPSGAAASDPALKLVLFTDATTVTTGDVKLRFIHASPGTPAVDVGLGTGAGFSKVFANVSFSHFATNAPIDSLGYVQTTPVTSAVTARIANANTDALSVPGVSLPAGAILSAFALGNKTGASDHPLQVLLCNDTAPPAGLAASCTLAP